MTITKSKPGDTAGFSRPPARQELAGARSRLAGRVRRTPVIKLVELQDTLGIEIYVKCENQQVTGAFKARGALNAVLSMRPEERSAGVATHSSGNHGAALAWAASQVGTSARIVMPHDAVSCKRDAVRRHGGEVIDCGSDHRDRVATLERVVAETGAAAIPPFDDARVIAGQATVTWEFLEQCPELDWLIVPLGGGGLLSGAILAARERRASLRIVGIEPKGADEAKRSLEAGTRLERDIVQTIADGLRAPVSDTTFSIIRSGVEDLVAVSDTAILAAAQWALSIPRLLLEPSGAVGLAALFGRTLPFRPKAKVGVVLSGGNLDFGSDAFRLMQAQGAGVPG